MNKEEKLAEKAEVIQAVKALFIPLSLFLSCIMFAAGVFLLVNSELLGWVFIAATVVVSLWAFVALIQFQNRYRAKGIMPDREDIIVQFDDDNLPVLESGVDADPADTEPEKTESTQTSEQTSLEENSDSEEAVAK